MTADDRAVAIRHIDDERGGSGAHTRRSSGIRRSGIDTLSDDPGGQITSASKPSE